jgi:hypothetical protein
VTLNHNHKCGFIFGLNYLNKSILEKDNYFIFIINRKGYLILSKFLNGKYSEIIKEKSEEIYDKFDIRNTYKITIKYIPYIGKIIARINDIVVFDIFDNSLNGRYVGFESLGKETVLTQILVEQNLK